MRKVTGSVAAILVSLLLLAATEREAAAQCTTSTAPMTPSTAPMTGDIVTCSGTSSTPVNAVPGSTNVKITIDNGATVSAAHNSSSSLALISVEGASSITNNGTLSVTGTGAASARGVAMLVNAAGNTASGQQLTNSSSGTIYNTGAFNIGMAVTGDGRFMLFNGGSITTTGPSSYGMAAGWGASGNIDGTNYKTLTNNGTILVQGSSSRGISVIGSNDVVNNNAGKTITATGSSSAAVYFQGVANSLYNEGTISATGANSVAVNANLLSPTATLTITNTLAGKIESTQAEAIRVSAGTVRINNYGTISSDAGQAIIGNSQSSINLFLGTRSVITGLVQGSAGNTNTLTLNAQTTAPAYTGNVTNAFQNFNSLTMEGSNWNWSGSGTFDTVGVQNGRLEIASGGSIGASSASVGATSAYAGYGISGPATLMVNGAGSQFSATTLLVGAGGAGALTLDNGGLATVTNLTVGSSGFTGRVNIGSAQGVAAAAPGQLATSTVALGDNGAVVFNHSDTSGNYDFNPVITGTGQVLQLSGTTVLGAASPYSGATTVTGGMLEAGGANVLSPNSAFTVASAGTLNLNGHDQTLLSLNNAGVVTFGHETVPGTSLVTTNYVGQGGALVLNTTLGTDGSPSDRLVINSGSASGTTFLHIVDIGGTGAKTTGDGILVVDTINGGTTASNSFALGAPVVAGAFEYDLYHGAAASNTQDWYLRSELDCSHPENAAVCAHFVPPEPEGPGSTPGSTPGSEPGSEAGPGHTPAPPHYRIETALDSALPSIALLYGRNLLDTLQERVGEEWDGPRVGKAPASPWSGGWVRMIGSGGSQRGDPLGVYGTGPQFSYGFLGLQGGQDLIRHESTDGGRDHAGVTFAIGGAHGDVTHFDGTKGADDFEAYTLGGYWTHFGAQGWYTDLMLQATRYDARTSADRGLPPFTTTGYGVAGSFEAGYRWTLAHGFFIEPQAQLLAQHIEFNNGFDDMALVSFNDVDSLLGRIGTRLGRSVTIDPDGRQLTLWLRPSLWQEFRGNPATRFGSGADAVDFHSDLGGSFGEINVGVSGEISRMTTLFANVSYQSRFDGGGYSYNGKAGIRMTW